MTVIRVDKTLSSIVTSEEFMMDVTGIPRINESRIRELLDVGHINLDDDSAESFLRDLQRATQFNDYAIVVTTVNRLNVNAYAYKGGLHRNLIAAVKVTIDLTDDDANFIVC